MSKCNVAVIGTGYMGMVHIDQLMRVPSVQILGISDKNVKLASYAASRYEIPKVYSDAREAIEDKDVDVIHNCTPSSLHFELSKLAISAGKDVFSEKPLALNSRESAELVGLAREYGAVTAVNFCYRYYPVVQHAAARVARGDIGRVYSIMGSFLQDWLLYETDYSWRLDPRMAGSSNIIGDLGSHWCDLAQFISGLKITEVMAELRTILPVRKWPKNTETLTFSQATDIEYEDVPITLDDYGALLLRFNDGASGTFITSQLAAGRKAEISIEIYGSDGSLAWEHGKSTELWLGHRNEANQIFVESPILQVEGTRRYARLPSGHPMGYMDAVLNLLIDFYRAIDMRREGKEPDVQLPDFTAGHTEMLVLEAAIVSMRSGGWAKVAAE
ncbi:MAG: Gfo/Idh/MocA family oxidoreductase [Armatimonadetes bacterium]|nr:Gfo/Idh/MocA family oxidoreductase [Armatimonadota bacterium]